MLLINRMSANNNMLLKCIIIALACVTPSDAGVKQIEANPDAKRLYDDLLSNYNRLIRPVSNNTDTLTVYLRLKMSQLLEMNLRNQVMTTNLWVEQKWVDYKLRWDPEEYGGVEMLYVPSEHIWLPDIVLYNNADGNYEVTLMTKATLKYTGEVIWRPPAIYKSSCEINVLYFPYDEQSCTMKFGSWTYNGIQVDLKHMDQISGSNIVPVGIDLSEFYLSVEWDILAVPATRNEEYYPCCTEPYSDITFNLTMRRKTLFYTVNLIIPCVGITFLTVLVFYLPSDSGEKVTLCSSVLVSLTVFFLLLAEIIPPTSLAVPLLGKYLLFTMITVSLSICVTVCVLNVHFRSPSTHEMPGWVKTLFLVWMPKVLMLRRPPYSARGNYEENQESGYVYDDDYRPNTRNIRHIVKNILQFEKDLLFQFLDSKAANIWTLAILKQKSDEITISVCGNFVCGAQARIANRDSISDPYTMDSKSSPTTEAFESVASAYRSVSNDADHQPHSSMSDRDNILPRHMSAGVRSALEGVLFIAQHIKDADKDNEVVEDWKYVSMVLDRLFLWVFFLLCLGGTFGIILQAPSLYDQRISVDQQLRNLIQFPEKHAQHEL